MLGKSLVGAIAITAALWMAADAAAAADDSKYPNLKGQWVRAHRSRRRPGASIRPSPGPQAGPR
jgi:hypothetical protein